MHACVNLWRCVLRVRRRCEVQVLRSVFGALALSLAEPREKPPRDSSDTPAATPAGSRHIPTVFASLGAGFSLISRESSGSDAKPCVLASRSIGRGLIRDTDHTRQKCRSRSALRSATQASNALPMCPPNQTSALRQVRAHSQRHPAPASPEGGRGEVAQAAHRSRSRTPARSPRHETRPCGIEPQGRAAPKSLDRSAPRRGFDSPPGCLADRQACWLRPWCQGHGQRH